jgi:uncharacterized protein
MFLSLGNITANPNIGLLFIDFEKLGRLRLDEASVSRDDPLTSCTVGAQLIIRVKARAIYPNCPRYIPKIKLVEPSIYAPRDGIDPLEPVWKSLPEFRDAMYPRQKTYRSSAAKNPGDQTPDLILCRMEGRGAQQFSAFSD